MNFRKLALICMLSILCSVLMADNVFQILKTELLYDNDDYNMYTSLSNFSPSLSQFDAFPAQKTSSSDSRTLATREVISNEFSRLPNLNASAIFQVNPLEQRGNVMASNIMFSMGASRNGEIVPVGPVSSSAGKSLIKAKIAFTIKNTSDVAQYLYTALDLRLRTNKEGAIVGIGYNMNTAFSLKIYKLWGGSNVYELSLQDYPVNDKPPVEDRTDKFRAGEAEKIYFAANSTETIVVEVKATIDNRGLAAPIYSSSTLETGEGIVVAFDYQPISSMEFLNPGDNTLPVTLSSFNAISLQPNLVNIQWTTQSESELLGYHVYRSHDNQLSHAERISVNLINAQNISSESQYQFQDSSVEADTEYYYWLQTAEMDGSLAYFGPVYVKTKTNEESTSFIPALTKINNAYPNPFNPSTNIAFDLSIPDNVKIDIYNTKGQLVKNIVSRFYNPGTYSVSWDGRDSNGNKCSTGIYFYRMTSSGYSQTRKMMIMK